MTAAGASRVTRVRVVALTACLAFSSCASVDNPWTYRFTREAYQNGYWSSPVDWSQFNGPDESWVMTVVAVVAMVAAPVLLDTALLPITVPHDMFWAK